MSFRTSLEGIRERFQISYADGHLCVHDYLKLSADACLTLEAILRGIGGDDEQFNQLVSDCEGMIVQYVVPLDLAKYKIPMVLEKFVIDPQLPLMVRPLLNSMRPAEHQEGPAGP